MSALQAHGFANALHLPLDWVIEGTLRHVGGGVPDDLKGEISLGDWIVVQKSQGAQWTAKRELKNVAMIELYLRIYGEVRALEAATTLSTRHSYYLDPINALSTNHTGPEPAYMKVAQDEIVMPPASNLSPEAVEDIEGLYSLLLKAQVDEAAARLILQDLRLAIEDASKYSLLHLYRALDTIRGDFGGWKAMRKQLGISKNYLTFVTRLRSERFYRVAHSDAATKSDEKKEISTEDVEEATRRTLDIVRRYFVHVSANHV